MCGRYGRRADKQRIAEWMQTHNTNVFDDSSFAPAYNVAPQSLQPVVRLDSETGQRELTVMRWGLVPFWTLLANSTGPRIRVIDLKTAHRASTPWSRITSWSLSKLVGMFCSQLLCMEAVAATQPSPVDIAGSWRS